MKTVTCKIQRFNPHKDSAHRYQTYRVPVEDTINVYQLLRTIFERLDSSIAFSTFYCGKGMCQSCLMQINGKTARACETLVSPGDEVTLRPLPNRPIIRDLVVDFGRPHRTNGDEVTVTRGAFLRMGRS